MIVANQLLSIEQSKPYFWILLVATATNFGLNFYFVPNFGFVGAAITTIISNSIYFLIGYFWSQKVFYIKRNLIKPVIYFSIGLSVSIFFPFYEYHIGSHISYVFKTGVLITVLTLPFIFNFIEISTVMSLINNVKQKIKG